MSKVRSSTVESVLYQRDTATRQSLNAYLFADLPEVDPAVHPAEFRAMLEPLLISLKIALNIDTASRRNPRRRSLKRVMLQLTSEVIGETRFRLSRAFEYFDFVNENIGTLKDDRWWVRAKGCKNAGLMLNEAALPYLEQCLDDENDDVRIEAAQAMLDIAGVDIIAPILMRLQTMSLWMRVRLSRSILLYGEHAVAPLVTAMRSDVPEIQGFCVEMLGILGDVKAVPTLLEYIDYSVPEVKHKSLIALGKIGDDRSVPVIRQYLDAEQEQLRIDAARAAGNLSSPSLVYHLHWLLVKDVMPVKLAAGEALSRSGGMGIKSLRYALELGNEEVRMVAMQFLHEAGVDIHHERTEGGAA